ncbi:FtsX-like permease family protein [Streptomyces griseus]|uniref:FtsX-like permease family protein n=1 Tax=Streptomyces griseus TaxID=1911 RepID=UPI000AA809B9|nr:FtsX-like permease family protein [Streptomyces griseus]
MNGEARAGAHTGARPGIMTDLRLAWQLTRGSDRREWWRVGLTAAGAALATGFALAAAVLASLRGYYRVPVGNGLLNAPGERSGVIVSLLLLLVPVLGFLGQCARIGAVHRDRRLAGLRLAGATPAQVRRIAGLETGLACLLGSTVATVTALAVLLSRWDHPVTLVWFWFALIALGVPVLGAAAGALALRRVVTSPLGWVRRVRPGSGRGVGLLFLGAVLLVVLTAVLAVAGTSATGPGRGYGQVQLLMFGLVLAVGAGTVWLAGATAGVTGRLLAARARSAATLIAAERLRADPWATARTHAAVLLVTVVGTGFVGIRRTLLTELNGMRERHTPGMGMSFYTTGLNLTAAAIAVALAITMSGLAVGTAESLAGRRRGLAAQAAAGVPRAVLGRALLLETALPLAPAVAVAGVGGMAIGVWYASLPKHGEAGLPYVALLVPVGVYACCLLAAATSLPLLRRSVRPAELRYV